jgi:hypothetical protein
MINDEFGLKSLKKVLFSRLLKSELEKVMFIKILILLCSIPLLAQDKINLPNSDQRQKAFQNFVAEINRLDGEGLIPRFNRNEDWSLTTQKLVNEARAANSLFAFGRVFKRLDATYPNLHARVHLRQELDQEKAEGIIQFHFNIRPQLLEKNSKSYSYFITDPKKNSNFIHGDEILEINGQSITDLEKENFLFCKFPTFSQCALELETNLKKELLGWNRGLPLKFKLKRKGLETFVDGTFEVIPWEKKPAEKDLNCLDQESRYQNFSLDYKGYNLCAYKSVKYPGKLILRIKSFGYAPDDPITDLNAEVDMFWYNYWRKESHLVKELIIDVIGNYGGQSPIPYYGLFATSPYQEQYTQFKKIKEFEHKDIFESLFWGDKAKEIWLEDLKSTGQFSGTKEGDFLPTVPQFCADQTKSCVLGLFQPRRHKFRGKIKIMVDQWCISSCVGFVDNMSKLFKNRLKIFGHEDSADSTYSRLTLALSFDDNGEKLQVLPLSKAKKPDPPLPWVRQVVSVTRSTDNSGQILSGKPQKIDGWIPRKWNQSLDEWSKSVFKSALHLR